MQTKIDPCATMRNNLITAALGLQQCTKTAAGLVPLADGRVIAIGTPAQVLDVLPELRDLVLEEAAEALDALNDSSGDAAAYDRREMYPDELEREHAIARCAATVRALMRGAAAPADQVDSEGGHHD